MALEFSDLDLDEYQVGGTLCLGFDDVDIRILRPRFDKFIACFQAWLGKKQNELQTSLTHQHRIHVWYVYSVIYIYTKIYVPIYHKHQQHVRIYQFHQSSGLMHTSSSI